MPESGVRSQTPGLRHPSFKEEGTGKRCSECGSTCGAHIELLTRGSKEVKGRGWKNNIHCSQRAGLPCVKSAALRASFSGTFCRKPVHFNSPSSFEPNSKHWFTTSFLQPLEEGAGKRCSECAFEPVSKKKKKGCRKPVLGI